MHFLVYSDERVWTPELWTSEVLYLYEADGQKTQESLSLDTQEQIRCCRSGTGQQNIELNSNLMKARKAGWMRHFDGLYLDQRDFAPSMARCLRIVARPSEIP